MVPPPSWMYYLFGLFMLVVAAYGAILLILSILQRRPAGRDVEISHVAMGIAMAGMFVPDWVFGSGSIWVLIFIVLLVWFVARSVQSVAQFGLHVPHFAIHAVMSFAMLLMYWFPAGSGLTTMSMSMGSTSSRGPDAALTLLVSLILFGSAVFTVASPNKGATHYGTHGPGSVHAGNGERPQPEVVLPVPSAVRILQAASLVDASHVVMAVAMGLMLVLSF